MSRILAAVWWFVVAASACGGRSTEDEPAPDETGGSSSTGGTGSTGGTAARECVTAADCRLVGDCCTCEAVPVSTPSPPVCDAACSQDACSARHVTAGAVDCVGGRCILGYDCFNAVECAGVRPNCSQGQVASGRPGCWGSCVPVNECSHVADCADCDPETTVCMRNEALGRTHCVATPRDCLRDRSCACLGESVCLPGFICTDLGENSIACGCVTC